MALVPAPPASIDKGNPLHEIIAPWLGEDKTAKQKNTASTVAQVIAEPLFSRVELVEYTNVFKPTFPHSISNNGIVSDFTGPRKPANPGRWVHGYCCASRSKPPDGRAGGPVYGLCCGLCADNPIKFFTRKRRPKRWRSAASFCLPSFWVASGSLFIHHITAIASASGIRIKLTTVSAIQPSSLIAHAALRRRARLRPARPRPNRGSVPGYFATHGDVCLWLLADLNGASD